MNVRFLVALYLRADRFVNGSVVSCWMLEILMACEEVSTLDFASPVLPLGTARDGWHLTDELRSPDADV